MPMTDRGLMAGALLIALPLLALLVAAAAGALGFELAFALLTVASLGLLFVAAVAPEG